MTTTMQLIAKQTIGAGGATGVTFSNIPQTYDDLKIVISARLTNTSYGETIRVKPNGSTANGFSRILRAYGTGVSAYRVAWINATNNALGDGAVAGAFTSIQMYCTNYTSSGYKSFSTESASPNNTTDGRLEITSSVWSDNTAITSISFDNNAGTPFAFKEGSTFYLYGISKNTTTQNTSVPYASGGDVITTDGTYWYHAFKYSGSFTPLKDITADVLVVAGGGGAGELGGGGAGGVLAFAAQVLTSGTASTCTIGAAGTGVSGGSGTNGGNSQFASLTAGVGGGGGVGYNQGISGGSGGGTGRVIAYVGTGTSGQGNNGGYSTNTGDVRTGGGGGGAGGVGGNCTQTSWASGAGGAGTNSVTNWGALSSMLTATSLGVSGYIAGGGGGGGDDVAGTWGVGGSGGGGDGGSSGHTATAGVANTGSGGGGVGVRTNSSKNGGSGLIVVRYAV